MTARRPLSLNSTLWVGTALTLASTVLGASAIYGYQLYRASQHQEQVRASTIAETYGALAAPSMLRDEHADAQSYLNQLAWHPSVVLVALLKPDGRPIASRGDASLLGRYLNLPGAAIMDSQTQTWQIPGNPDFLLPDMVLAAVPITPAGAAAPIGRLICATRTANQAQGVTGKVWSFFSLLMLVAATGLILSVYWIKKAVIHPLAELTQAARDLEAASAQHVLHADRPDEIGEVARVVLQLRQTLGEWKERGVRLERTMSDRIAAQTQKVTREMRRLERKSWTDPLTQLGNRQLFEDKFARIFQAQAEAGMDLSVVMIDVDNFKKLNDTLGHRAGDELLTFIGELLKQCLREEDLAIRFGGDEFILILPGVKAEEAERIAQRTIRMFAQQSKLLNVSPKPTMSAGIASLHQHHPATPDGLLQLGDEALYAAKRAGKSQALVYNRPLAPALSR